MDWDSHLGWSIHGSSSNVLRKAIAFQVQKSWLLAAALLSITLRVGAYCIIPENDRRWIWFVLFTEAFIRGIGNGAIQIAAVDQAAEIAGPELQATAQGIFASVYNGFSGIIGSLGSGTILKLTNNNIRWALVACVIVTSSTLIIQVAFLAVKRILGKDK